MIFAAEGEVSEHDLDGEIEDGEDCGRWDNSQFVDQCSKAGSEECDWICPYGYVATVKRRRRTS
jgi:hypothetical protein